MSLHYGSVSLDGYAEPTGLLIPVFLLVEFLLLLEFQEVLVGYDIVNVWADELWLGEPCADESVVADNEAHFFLREDKREETVVASPSRDSEVTYKGYELLNERAKGWEGWLPDDFVDWVSFHLSAYNFGDGGYGGLD